MGLMSTSTEQLKVACVNLALTQAQAVIVSFVAAVFTVAVSVIQTGQVSNQFCAPPPYAVRSIKYA